MASALSQYKVWGMISEQGASQVALVVRNPAASAGHVRDTGSIPELGTREEKNVFLELIQSGVSVFPSSSPSPSLYQAHLIWVTDAHSLN